MGESVFKFEEEFARYCGTRHAVFTGSGTAAVQIALQALGLSSDSVSHSVHIHRVIERSHIRGRQSSDVEKMGSTSTPGSREEDP